MRPSENKKEFRSRYAKFVYYNYNRARESGEEANCSFQNEAPFATWKAEGRPIWPLVLILMEISEVVMKVAITRLNDGVLYHFGTRTNLI